MKSRKCKNPACSESFVPTFNSTQKVCSWSCGLAIKDVNADKASKAIKTQERAEHRIAKEKIKTKGDYAKEAQQAFNEFIRLRDADLPCVSCVRHHDGKYDAGHYRTVGGNPALRYEPLNCAKQCVPCNRHKSGDVINFRLELVRRIGQEKVDWLEGPHEPKRYTIEDLKAIKAHYRAKVRELKNQQKEDSQ
jgi:hypothetical protein